MASLSKSKVSFFFETSTTLEERERLKRFIESIFRKEKKDLAGLNYIFCTDKRLLEINRRFLNHDYYTDIITFDLSQDKKNIEAEIYISSERVRDNAKNHGQTQKKELHRVIFHGVLHLCGYRDKTKAEIEKMREKEEYYLSRYFS